MPQKYGANNPFMAFLEEEPEAGYFSYQNQWNTPNQKKWFQSQFSNIQNQYMGALGSQIRHGQDPTLRFADFLKQFNWGQNFQQEGPQQDTSRFSPFTRWMV